MKPFFYFQYVLGVVMIRFQEIGANPINGNEWHTNIRMRKIAKLPFSPLKCWQDLSC